MNGRSLPGAFDPSALDAAGFAEVEVSAVDAVQVWGSDAADAGAFFAEWGPVRHHLGLAGADAAVAARAAIVEEMRRYERPGAVELRGAAWLITATRP